MNYSKQINNLPLISIITVVLNCKLKLAQTIESIINQSYKKIEYIIIDGGSTDGTLDIIKMYSNYINKWVSEKDDGLYFAMNKGTEMCNGEWVIFMNSGDFFESNYTINNVINFNLNVYDLIYGKTRSYNNELKCQRITGKKVYFPKDFILKTPICHQSIFYKKKLLDQYKFDTKYKLVADYDQLIKIFKAGHPTLYIDHVISKFEIFESASRGKRRQNYKERIIIFKKYFSNFLNIKEVLLMYQMFLTSTILDFCENSIIIKFYRKAKVQVYRKIFKE